MSTLSLNSLPSAADNKLCPVDIEWQNARNYMEQNYTADQLVTIQSATCAGDIIAHLDSLQKEQKNRASVRRLARIKPVLDGFEAFDEVLKIYSGSYAAAALIWGSIKLVLMVGSLRLIIVILMAN
jgi:hypothetical protein